jgi:beta-lactamase class A
MRRKTQRGSLPCTRRGFHSKIPGLRAAALCVALQLALPLASLSDEAPELEIAVPSTRIVFEDEQLQKMWALDAIAPFEDKAPLWSMRDPEFQRMVEAEIKRLGLQDEVKRKQLSLAIVDVTDPENPRFAGVNGDRMIYAASLPKIAVLLTAFELIAQHKLEYDAEIEALLKNMIRRSSNSATTEMMHRVGKENIARVLLSPRYRLYDPDHNGGLWVGKDYAKSGTWKRDPIHNISHGATAIQVARFYYLLLTGNLVTPEHSSMMLEIMANSQINHKFQAALAKVAPQATLYRKSGSWSTYHSDSAIVKHDGRTYILVALSNDAQGKQWMMDIAAAMDGLIMRTAKPPATTPRRARALRWLSRQSD